MLVLGIMTAHVPLPVLARMPTDDCDSMESCGTCECDPDGPVAGQGSPRAPDPPLAHMNHAVSSTSVAGEGLD
jgi:hypothetical protein